MSQLCVAHICASNNVLCYLRGCVGKALFFSQTSRPINLVAFGDANWALV